MRLFRGYLSSSILATKKFLRDEIVRAHYSMVGDPDAGTLLRYVLRSIACHRPEKFSCFLIYGQSKAQWGGSCTWTNAYQAILVGLRVAFGGFHFRPALRRCGAQHLSDASFVKTIDQDGSFFDQW